MLLLPCMDLLSLLQNHHSDSTILYYTHYCTQAILSINLSYYTFSFLIHFFCSFDYFLLFFSSNSSQHFFELLFLFIISFLGPSYFKILIFQIFFLFFQVFVNDPNCQDLVWKLRRSLARSKVPEKEILSSLEYHDSNGSGYVSMKQFTKVCTCLCT